MPEIITSSSDQIIMTSTGTFQRIRSNMGGNINHIRSTATTPWYLSSPNYTTYSTTTNLSNTYISFRDNSFISVTYNDFGEIVNTHTYHCPPKPKINHRLIRDKRNFARKALWKSIRTFESLFGINNIQLFLNGESFEIEGRKFNYKISKKKHNSLIRHTQNPSSHIIPYNLEIYNKQGLFLFSGCTIFKNTPVIDQITALLLYIQSEEEEDLIKNMNLSRLSDNFYNDLESIEIINSIKDTNYQPKLII